jgi:hypothetical protein
MSLAPIGLALWLVQSAAPAAAPASAGPPSAAAPAAKSPAAARPKPPEGLSWEDADQMAETVARLERRLKAGKPASREAIAVSERQVNSYVTLALASKIPAAVSGLSVRFEPGVLAASGLLDLDAVRSKVPQGSAGGLASLLSGTVPVTLRGRFSGANGQGKVEVDEAVVGGIHLPAALVAQLVAQATRSAADPVGFDLLAPFPLPWTARSVRLEAGRVVVDFTQPPAR